jgi:hypothetical protein
LDWPQDTHEARLRQQLLEPVQKGLIGKSGVIWNGCKGMTNCWEGIKTTLTRLYGGILPNLAKIAHIQG